MLVGCATAASLFPFVGPIVYMVLRPPEYLDDVREREIEIQAAEARLHEFDRPLSPLRLPHRARLRALPDLPAKLKERGVNCRDRWTGRGRSARTARPMYPALGQRPAAGAGPATES